MNPAVTAHVAAGIAWPVVYLLWNFIFSAAAAPFFLAPEEREKSAGRSVTRADLFEALGAAGSQFLCLFAGSSILGIFNRVPGFELLLIYSAWAFLMVVARGPVLGLPGRHGVIPDAVGMAAGLGAGYLIIF